MSFIDNIKEFIGAESVLQEGEYRAVVFGSKAVYVERVKCIISYEKEQILLGLKKGVLEITGKDLYVKKYCLGDVVICGNICSLTRR
jgi:sporulation protein YqfC